MSDELRERIVRAIATSTGLTIEHTADAVMTVLLDELGEPETEYGIRWRNEDYVMPVAGYDVDYLRREMKGAAKYNIPTEPHVRTVCYGPWRPIDIENEETE